MKKLEYWDKTDTLFQKVWVDGKIESTLSQEKSKWPEDLVNKVEKSGYYVEYEDENKPSPSTEISKEELDKVMNNNSKEELPKLDSSSINAIVDLTRDDEIDNFTKKHVKESRAKKATDDYKNSKDMVAKPEHYNSGRYETIDKIDDFLRGKPITATTAYAIGNSLKYLDRIGKKAPDQGKGQTQAEKNVQDLTKATWYMLFATMSEKGLLPNDITPKIHEILKIMES